MMSKELNFSITRHDMSFDKPESLEEIFKFAEMSHLTPTPDGTFDNRDENYDFKYQSSPHLIIGPVSENTINEINIPDSKPLNIKDLILHVNVMDKLFNIREHIIEIPLTEVQYNAKEFSISLKKYDHLSFKNGYTIECFISRKDNVDEESNFFWHKSQQIASKSYHVKTSSDGALFDIKWQRFEEDYSKKYVTHYVNWLSDDVSSIPSEESFEVFGNEEIQDEIMRFSARDPQNTGKFISQLIFCDIARELIEKTLRLADRDDDPVEESLHYKIKKFLNDSNEDFDRLCEQMERGGLEELSLSSNISKIIQINSKMAERMKSITFISRVQ